MTKAGMGTGWLALLAVALVVSGCGVLGRRAPDETQVTDNPSLIVPPNFDLRPPRSGGDPEAVLRQRNDDARALITGSGASTPASAPVSATTTSNDNWLLQRDAAAPVPPAARPQTVPTEEKSFWQRWFGWTGL